MINKTDLMKSIIAIATIVLFTTCKNNTKNPEPNNTMTWFDSIPFGTVQPALEANTPGEKIKRIDSLVRDDSSYSIYYVTDKGSRVYHTKGKFSTLVIKGYKADGKHSCVGATLGKKEVSYCYDSACTIVIDSIQLDRKIRPYPVLHPELDKADSCR